jgi:putative RNA 2'-phosphotransferase
MLRHRPEEFGVAVDAQGYADLEAVLAALQERDAEIEMADIEALVTHAEKQRFEISDGRIRARYGHSIEVDLGIDPVEPPEFLYKGVDRHEVREVLEEGLEPFDRQYVHLSFDRDVAERLASRRSRGVVIKVAARRAHEDGVAFYDCGPTVLVRRVPPEYLEAEEVPEPTPAPRPAPSTAAPAAQEGPVTYGRKRRFSGRR